MLAVTATFFEPSGVLSVWGDGQENTIDIGRTVGGDILVNGGAVSIQGGTPTIGNTDLIQAFGLGGNDTITVDETNGAMPSANLYGGSGEDVLTGGSAIDRLFAQSGADTASGGEGNDFVFGGADNDELTGDGDNDQVFGQSGNDQLIWNPGDGTDLNEGGGGTDSSVVNGSGDAEVFAVIANGTRVQFNQVNPDPSALDIGTTENLVVNANDGNDTFTSSGNLAALIQITVDGGAGDDTLIGSNGVDILIGGDDNDFIDGNQAIDLVLLGDGDDTFRWDPGDGNDVVEGQAGDDTLEFNGSGSNELIEVSANGSRVSVTRDISSIDLDLNGVEHFDINTFAGTDTVVVNDLAGTDAVDVNVDLAASGGGVGDAQADDVIVNATNSEDGVSVNGSSSGVSVFGLATVVNINNAETADDRLTVNLLDGEDVLDASGLEATGIALTVDGGDDADAITGGDGSDVLLGGLGDDILIGGLGIDFLDGGPGDNIVIQ